MAAGGVLVGRGYVSIRPEFEGDWSRTANARGSSAGRSGAQAFSRAFGAGLKGVGALAGVAVAANLTGVAGAAAALAPALATAGTAAAALKIGLSGVGEAFKQAFADNASDAKAAASATRAVESAQRGLANAQRALADARVQAAERVRDAQRAVADAERDLADTVEESARRQRDAQAQVRDAERDLRDAQRDAREAQLSLTDARQEAVRTLEDMNQRLAESQLDEREAVLRLKQAEEELKAAQQTPGATPEQIAKLRLAYDRAKLQLQEQRTETKRLSEDSAKANKAGVEGSEEVRKAKERIGRANETVADKQRALAKAEEDARRSAIDGARAVADAQRALADAQRGVDQARAEGQRQIEDAQRGVAEAAQALADAQAAAASQMSKLDDAMSKLAPNARSFVNAVRGLAPAWDAMRLSVQNRLFEGLDTTVVDLAHTTLPILQRQLTATAGIWNDIAKNAAGAVSSMAKSGMLEDILKGANANFALFKQVPGQLITAFGQLTVAAQPAFNRLAAQFAGAIGSFTDGIAKSFESGGLQAAIDTAFGILSQFGTLLGNALGVVVQIMKAASDAGAEIVGVLGSVFGELRKILAAPEIQAALRSIFTAVAQIVGTIAPLIGAVVQQLIPLVAMFTPFIAQITEQLGPVLMQLVSTLGSALKPIIAALLPVLYGVSSTIVQLVQSALPLLRPIADLISAVIVALAPALEPITRLMTGLVRALVGPLGQIIESLTPALVTVAGVVTQVVESLDPLLGPLVGLIGQAAAALADVFASGLDAVMDALAPLIPVGMQLINSVLAALMPSLISLGRSSVELTGALLPILPAVTPLIGVLAQLATTVLSVLLPPLTKLISFLAGHFAQTVARVVGVISGAINAMVSAFRWFYDVLIGHSILPDIVTYLTGPFAGVFRWLYNSVVRPVWRAIQSVINSAWLGVRVTFAAIRSAINGPLAGVFRWLRDRVVRPAWDAIRLTISGTWSRGIRPIFDTLRSAVHRVADSFESARKAIKTAWDKLKAITKAPVQFIVDIIYNKGIVGVWNKIAGAFGAPKLKTMKFAGGGVYGRNAVLPGYTPGRDPHKFYSPTGGQLEMSGGEAIMRPEFTRGAGAGFVSYFNRLAKSGGAASVRKALAPVLGGNPRTDVDNSLRYANGGTVQRFADGGVFGWIGKTLKGAGSAAWNAIKEGASWLKDGIEGSVRAGVKSVVTPLLKSFPGADTGFGKVLTRIPTKMLDVMFGYSKEADKKGAAGIGGPRIQAALRWARTQNGKRYQWGGNGNPSWDCSGFMSAIESVIRGQKPHRRWSTHAFHGQTAPPGWVYHGNSPFRVGITAAGVGHTAGTLGGVNAESRGGDGVIVGKRARGYNNGLFTSWYGFKPGSYDNGGWLGPGQLGVNNLRQPEAVLTPNQWRTLSAAAVGGDGMSLDGQRLRLVVGGREFDAYVEERADGRVAANNRALATLQNARRRG